jgi:hypothetical protein
MDLEAVRSLISKGRIEAAAAGLLLSRPAEAASLLMGLKRPAREAFFHALCRQDIEKTCRALCELKTEEALELICEFSLKSMESHKRQADDARLLRQIDKNTQLVQEIHNYVYTILAQNAKGTENVSYVKGVDGVNLCATRTRFVRYEPIRNTCLTSSDDRPLSYRVHLGDEGAIDAVFDSRFVDWRVRVPSGEIHKRMRLHRNVRLLDNFTWHHFLLLLDRYDDALGGTQRLMLFVPSIGQETVSNVRWEGLQTVEIGGGLISARYYTVALNHNAFVEMWTNESKSLLIIQEKTQGLKVAGEEVFLDTSALR